MGNTTIKCPYCSSYQVVRNGHPHSKILEFFCKSCHKYFYDNTIKGYPSTSTPFPVIAYLLYFRKKIPTFSNMRAFRNFVNQWLECLGIRKREVSRQIIHHWIKNFEPGLENIISFNEARDYVHRVLSKDLKGVPKDVIRAKSLPYKDALHFLERSLGRGFCVELSRRDPVFFHELTSIVSKYPVYCKVSLDDEQQLGRRLFFKGVVK